MDSGHFAQRPNDILFLIAAHVGEISNIYTAGISKHAKYLQDIQA